MKHFSYKPFIELLLVVPLVMTGCQRHRKAIEPIRAVKTATADTAKDTITADTVFSETRLLAEREVVLERARDIFRVVKDYQRSMGGFVMSELLDKSYCSKSWNKLLLSVHRKEYQSNSLFFEIDYWTMTRDPSFVTYDEFEVSKIAVDGQRMFASVDYTVYEMFTYTPARIDMIFEDGRWVINNFYDMKFMVDVRNSMLQYLVTDMM